MPKWMMMGCRSGTARGVLVGPARTLFRYRFAFPLFLLPFTAPPVLALDPSRAITQYVRRSWLAGDGLPQNSVHVIHQTKDGYLWFGTEEGLARYDGATFTVFDQKRVPSIRQNYILALVESWDGGLWIGTAGGGLTRYKDGAFIGYGEEQGFRSNNNAVRTLYEDEKGRLWIGTLGAGVFLFENDRFTRFTTNEGLSHDFVRDIVSDGEGGLWIATVGGLNHFREGGVTRIYTARDGLSDDVLISLYKDRTGRLWVGAQRGLSCLENDHSITVYDERRGLPADAVTAIFEDRSGNFWVGTDGGLSRLRGNRFETLTTRDGLPGQRIRSIYEDREGSLWVGAFGGGLNQLRDGKFVTLTTREGLSHDMIGPVFQARNGDMWIGTMGGGVNRIRNGKITKFTTRNGLASNILESIEESRDGSIWFGTSGLGVSRMKNGSIRSYRTRDGLPNNSVLAILEDSRGRIWFGTNGGGLTVLENGRFRTYMSKDGLVNDSVRSLFEDSRGALWISTFGGGLSRLQDDVFTSYTMREGLSRNAVRNVYEDRDGCLWIGTMGGGLNRFQNGRFSHITYRDGLFDDTIYALLEDRQGRFWMSSNNGIFWASRQELEDFADGKIPRIHSVGYGEADGMRNRECNANIPPAVLAEDGKLWVATLGGVAVIDPEHLPSNPLPPPVHIETVIANHDTLQVRDGIAIRPGRNDLEVHYAALSYLAPEKVLFRYRLEGFDKEWVEAGTRRIAYYTNLPPGRYRFQVTACNNDGVWSEAGASLAFRMRPHFYQTWWFYGLCVIGVFLLGFALHRRRIEGLKARAQELQHLVDERTRAKEELAVTNQRLAEALTDLERAQEGMIEHERLRALGQMASGITHDFNNALSPILGYADLFLMNPEILSDRPRSLRYLETIHTAARDAGNVVSRLREFYRPREEGDVFPLMNLNGVVEQALSLSKPRWKNQTLANGITIDVKTDLQPLPLLPGSEAELREMLLNLLFNAVDAMPGGGSVRLATRAEGAFAVLEVSDTGSGMTEEVRQRCLEPFFTTKGERGTGLGLPMVYGVVKRHRGTFEIASEPGRGTTFTVRLPVEKRKRAETPKAEPEVAMQPLSILVVDDEPSVLRVMTEFLATDRHTVETASDGLEGLHRFRNGDFDLVVTDRAMPQMRGDQLAAAVKKLRPDVPVIMLTGFGEMMTAGGESPEGVDIVLGKPVTLAALREALYKVAKAA